MGGTCVAPSKTRLGQESRRSAMEELVLNKAALSARELSRRDRHDSA